MNLLRYSAGRSAAVGLGTWEMGWGAAGHHILKDNKVQRAKSFFFILTETFSFWARGLHLI